MDINGNHLATMQMQQFQQFQQFVQAAMEQALSMLAPGYKPTVIFTFKGRPERDIIVSGTGLDDVFGALVEKLRVNGIPMPANVQTQAAAPEPANGSLDLHLAVINIVSAIRRMAPPGGRRLPVHHARPARSAPRGSGQGAGRGGERRGARGAHGRARGGERDATVKTALWCGGVLIYLAALVVLGLGAIEPAVWSLFD